MKYIVFLTLSFALFVNADFIDEIDKFKKECLKELVLEDSNSTSVLIQNIIDGTFKAQQANYDAKCLLRCVLKRGGMFDENDKLLVDDIKAEIPSGVNIDFEKCLSIKNDDVCERAYALHVCFTEQTETKD